MGQSERLVMTMPSNSTTSSLQRWDASAAQQQQQQQQRQQQLSHAQALEMARAHARSHEVKAPLDVEERLCDNIPGLGVFLFRKDAQHNKRPQDFTQLNSVQKNAIVKIAYSIIEQVKAARTFPCAHPQGQVIPTPRYHASHPAPEARLTPVPPWHCV